MKQSNKKGRQIVDRDKYKNCIYFIIKFIGSSYEDMVPLPLSFKAGFHLGIFFINSIAALSNS